VSILTLAKAEDLAARTLVEMQHVGTYRPQVEWVVADRERIASDLAGLRGHAGVKALHAQVCPRCGKWPCDDALRYFDGLRRTAALYGVGDLAQEAREQDRNGP
jgi:hypothetical protein